MSVVIGSFGEKKGLRRGACARAGTTAELMVLLFLEQHRGVLCVVFVNELAARLAVSVLTQDELLLAAFAGVATQIAAILVGDSHGHGPAVAARKGDLVARLDAFRLFHGSHRSEAFVRPWPGHRGRDDAEGEERAAEDAGDDVSFHVDVFRWLFWLMVSEDSRPRRSPLTRRMPTFLDFDLRPVPQRVTHNDRRRLNGTRIGTRRILAHFVRAFVGHANATRFSHQSGRNRVRPGDEIS